MSRMRGGEVRESESLRQSPSRFAVEPLGLRRGESKESRGDRSEQETRGL